MSYLGKHAEYYDLFYKNKPYQEEAAYVADLIQQRCPNARTILDLGCGTGLRSLEMARLGYQICGLDQSPPMLSIARQHLANAKDIPPTDVEFLAGNITEFVTNCAYDAVISLFHVFSYLTTEESLRKAVICSFSNLRPGGVLLFDYWHGPGVLTDPPAIRKAFVENSTLMVQRTSIPTHFPEKHLVELSLSLEITDKDANIPQHVEETYQLRYWFSDELERQLDNSGFKDISHYAWLKQSAPGTDHWHACTIAVRP
jgi:SAM-dependent methyltransferase